MALKTQEREIDGVKYRVTQLGAVDGRAVLLRLLKAFGPSAAAMLGDNIAEAVAKLNLSEDDLSYFCQQFGQKTFVVLGDKTPRLDNVFDEHFAGRYRAMILWLGFAVEVNFADFLSDKAAAMLAGIAAAPQSEPAAK